MAVTLKILPMIRNKNVHTIKENSHFLCRPASLRDLFAQIECTRFAWYSDDGDPVWLERLFSLEYLLTCFSRCTHVLAISDKVTGQTRGTIVLQQKGIALSLANYLAMICNFFLRLVLLCISRAGMASSKKYRDNYALLEEHAPQNPSMAEIVLLVAHPDTHGKGAGKLLIKSAQQILKSEHVQNCYLLTDDECDYPFYDHVGFRTHYHTVLNFKSEPDEDDYRINCFIYKKTLQH